MERYTSAQCALYTFVQHTSQVDDYDLLLDTSLLLWKHSSQYYQQIFSCDLSMLRHYEHDQSHALTPPLNFVQLLVITQSIFHRLELWKIDVVLYTNVCLKFGFLFEGRAQVLQLSDINPPKYDRAKLLDSRVVIEAGLTAVNWACCNLTTDKVRDGVIILKYISVVSPGVTGAGSDTL